MRIEQGRGGIELPILGQGTWRMGEHAAQRVAEIDAIRLGLDLGLKLIDTAEMYADGGAEEIVAEALGGRRDEAFLVSKVLPQNASREGVLCAAEGSLKRLRTDRIDLYLLHWQGSHPLDETYAAFERLVEEGKIRFFGVSNFDTPAMELSESLPAGPCVTVNQILYNLERRNAEASLLPWCGKHDVLVMAYSPLEQARLPPGGALQRVAERHGMTPYQVALAWTVRKPGVVAIPKAVHPEHLRQNVEALELQWTSEDIDELNAEYPRPQGEAPLETL